MSLKVLGQKCMTSCVLGAEKCSSHQSRQYEWRCRHCNGSALGSASSWTSHANGASTSLESELHKGVVLLQWDI